MHTGLRRETKIGNASAGRSHSEPAAQPYPDFETTLSIHMDQSARELAQLNELGLPQSGVGVFYPWSCEGALPRW